VKNIYNTLWQIYSAQ